MIFSIIDFVLNFFVNCILKKGVLNLVENQFFGNFNRVLHNLFFRSRNHHTLRSKFSPNERVHLQTIMKYYLVLNGLGDRF